MCPNVQFVDRGSCVSKLSCTFYVQISTSCTSHVHVLQASCITRVSFNKKLSVCCLHAQQKWNFLFCRLKKRFDFLCDRENEKSHMFYLIAMGEGICVKLKCIFILIFTFSVIKFLIKVSFCRNCLLEYYLSRVLNLNLWTYIVRFHGKHWQ